jgi:hypothetical protein
MKTSRRGFLQMAALSLGALGARSSAPAQSAAGTGISLVVDPADSVASSQPVVFAIQQLMSGIARHDVPVRRFESIEQAPSSDLYIVAAGAASSFAAETLRKAGMAMPMPNTPECLRLVPSVHNHRNFLLACGRDARGLMYALLELADRVEHAADPLAALKVEQAGVEQPFNEIRSIGRLFSSDIEDKPWFNDREMWREYFAMLATQRFNRFHLAFGIGHDFLTHVKDAYFLFVYPFLVSPPGYNVRAASLPDDERDRNLEMLQFISSQAVAHGIDFQLGIWTHGYHWMDSPNPNYTIEGLTPENHAAYSRDALAAVLRACPAISGVTLRTHGESGVREGSYAFWKTVFEGIPQSGRKLEIDLHTKGLDQKLIDSALATGMPVKLSPKYWAEHTGMPYQQAAIRELEMPREKVGDQDFFALSSGSRSFTRYGYADFLRDDRPYEVFFRIWPGVHRFLLWGDPALTAAHARAFRFCGTRGVELFEPLSFKGRRGSGMPGGRCAYADRSLEPRRDWEKYLYTYRTWGRLLYDPETNPDVWRRYLRSRFQAGAPALESALANATQILPIIVTAHLPSAANDTYCPEFYTNQSIVDASAQSPYGDTPAPKVFGNVSPLDPQIFQRINDFAAELLTSKVTGKYSPIEVAQWLEDLAGKAAAQLEESKRPAKSATSPEFRRTAIDLKIQIGIGRFFAAKLRSGVLYGIHEQSGDRSALEEALKMYSSAREIWSGFAEEADGAYVSDISYGPLPHQRGHWRDRLPAIDADIAAMAKRLESLSVSATQSERARAAVQEALGRPLRPSAKYVHTPPASLVPGRPLEITVSVKERAEPVFARLWYRHVNQSERYQSVEMQANGSAYKATIPVDYTASKFPVQYYFELRQGAGRAWLYPGFAPGLANQPYFVVGGGRGKE